MNNAEATSNKEVKKKLEEKITQLKQQVKDREVQKQTVIDRIDKTCQKWEVNKDIELPGLYDRLNNELRQIGNRIVQAKAQIKLFEREIKKLKE